MIPNRKRLNEVFRLNLDYCLMQYVRLSVSRDIHLTLNAELVIPLYDKSLEAEISNGYNT